MATQLPPDLLDAVSREIPDKHIVEFAHLLAISAALLRSVLLLQGLDTAVVARRSREFAVVLYTASYFGVMLCNDQGLQGLSGEQRRLLKRFLEVMSRFYMALEHGGAIHRHAKGYWGRLCRADDCRLTADQALAYAAGEFPRLLEEGLGKHEEHMVAFMRGVMDQVSAPPAAAPPVEDQQPRGALVLGPDTTPAPLPPPPPHRDTERPRWAPGPQTAGPSNGKARGNAATDYSRLPQDPDHTLVRAWFDGLLSGPAEQVQAITMEMERLFSQGGQEQCLRILGLPDLPGITQAEMKNLVLQRRKKLALGLHPDKLGTLNGIKKAAATDMWHMVERASDRLVGKGPGAVGVNTYMSSAVAELVRESNRVTQLAAEAHRGKGTSIDKYLDILKHVPHPLSMHVTSAEGIDGIHPGIYAVEGVSPKDWDDWNPLFEEYLRKLKPIYSEALTAVKAAEKKALMKERKAEIEALQETLRGEKKRILRILEGGMLMSYFQALAIKKAELEKLPRQVDQLREHMQGTLLLDADYVIEAYRNAEEIITNEEANRVYGNTGDGKGPRVPSDEEMVQRELLALSQPLWEALKSSSASEHRFRASCQDKLVFIDSWDQVGYPALPVGGPMEMKSGSEAARLAKTLNGLLSQMGRLQTNHRAAGWLAGILSKVRKPKSREYVDNDI